MKAQLLATAILLIVALGIAPASARSGEGPILIDSEHPHSFRYSSGERFFPMGDTAYFLIAQSKEVITRYFETRRAHRFNFVRVMAAADGFWPFGGTPENPRYGEIDESALQKWDWVFDRAAENGINLELILFGYGVGGGEGLWANPEHQELWIRTLVNRFKHRKNLLMYTVANEFERYPDGKYVYQPADVEWVRNVAARIRELDPVHPIGCHPSVWITDLGEPGKSTRPFRAYRGFTQRLPPVVWPLWAGSALNLNVTQNNEGVQSRTWGDIGNSRRGLTYLPTRWQEVDYPARWTATGWDFEAAGLEDSIADERSRNEPVLNTEFGYQFEPGYEAEHNYTTRQSHQPATVRRKAWKIATAGGYFATGFTSTAVRRSFTLQDAENFRPQQLEVLYDFFVNETEYWKMSPRLELVASHNVLLADPGREYIAYFPRGGTNWIELAAGTYDLEWLHAESGRRVKPSEFTATVGRHEFAAPEPTSDDWTLHLRRREAR